MGEVNKMCYTIGQMSEKIGLSIDTLRYYEKEGLIIPKRDSNNRRVFDETDIKWIEFIKRLKETGMRLADIKTYAKLREQGEETIEERLVLLTQQTSVLLDKQQELANNLAFLDKKIALYQEMLTKNTQIS